MATVQRRGRACEACSKIKIRCELGSVADAVPPCERCVRLGKDCALVAPKRQRDRVAELEAQVERLTRILREKGISDLDEDMALPPTDRDAINPPASDATTRTSSLSKKRKRNDAAPSIPLENTSTTTPAPSSTPSGPEPTAILALDRVVPRSLQERLLDRYLHDLLPQFPLALPPDASTLDSIRREHPLLLQAIFYAAGPGVLPTNSQEDITRILLNELASTAIAEGIKSMELIQALQITCLWFRHPVHHRHIAVPQLVQLTSGIAVGLGLGGPESSPPLTFQAEGQDLECAHAWRAWLGCHLLSSAMAGFSRRSFSTPWTLWHDRCAVMLEYSASTASTDRLLTQYVRAERLCGQIVEQLGFYDMSTYIDLADASTKRKMQICRSEVLHWKAQIPATLQLPTLLYWEHVATAFLNEPVLHTPTNKPSFAAPYVSERLSVTDFPAPVVTPDHTVSLYELKSAAHSIIDIFMACEAAVLVAFPPLLFTSRAAYALYMLAKMYVAVTAPGNTYGAVLDADALQLEARIDQLLQKAVAINAIDVQCGSARILRSAQRAKEWYATYSTNLKSALASPTHVVNHMYPLPESSDVTSSYASQSYLDLQELFWSSEGAADYGLESMFADPSAAMDFDLMSSDPSKTPSTGLDDFSPLLLPWMV